MATSFTPPSPSEWQGPAPSSGGFTPPPVSSWQGAATGTDTPAFKQPEGSAASRAGSGLWDATIGGLGKAVKMLSHIVATPIGGTPNLEAIQDMHDLVQSHIDQAKKAKEAWGKGEHVEALGHGMAAALPLVGPAAAHAGERIGGEGPEFDKYGNVTKQGQAPDVAGGLGEGAGLVVASSPKNIAAPALRGVKAGLAKIPVPERLTPEGMYQSSLRPSLAKKNLPKIDKQVATGLRERIPVSRKGLEVTGNRIEDLNQEIADKIQGKSDQLGPVISPKAVASRVEDVRPTFAEQVNPEPDLTALDKSKSQFLDKHSTEAPYTKVRPGTAEAEGSMVPDGEGVIKTEKPLTLSEAQAEKQGTYRQLKKKFGELGSADVEAQKSLARGLKEEIMARVPELKGLNARDGALIELEGQLEKMVAREGNKNVIGLVPATMSHNPYGLAATILMDNPAIKSRIAIALDRARKISGKAPNPGNLSPAAIPGADLNEQEDIPHYAKGGIAGQDGPEIALVGEEGPELITPLTAEHATTPEKPGTLKVQLDQLASGERKAVMFPRGTPLLKRPKGTSAYQDESGNTFIFDPQKTSQREIDEAIQNNALPDLLGSADGGMGAPDKSALPSDPMAVVASDPKGETVQATATDAPHLRKTVRQTAKVTPKGGKVKIESPAKEISRRQGLSSPEPAERTFTRSPAWYDRGASNQQWFHKQKRNA